MSDPKAAWTRAFVAAQAKGFDITKDKEADTGSYKYRYADLHAIVDKVRTILSDHDLGVAQSVESLDGDVAVSTIVYHAEGHSETFGPLVMRAGNTPQATGSAITYARRYALCAALNIAADEDDDGKAASKDSQEAGNPTGSRPTPSPEPVFGAPWYGSLVFEHGAKTVLSAAQAVAERKGKKVSKLESLTSVSALGRAEIIQELKVSGSGLAPGGASSSPENSEGEDDAASLAAPSPSDPKQEEAT